MSQSLKIPPLCRMRRKRGSDSAYVRLDGKTRTYLGDWGSREAKQNYAELISKPIAGEVEPEGSTPSDPSVAELILAFLLFAKGFYQSDGGSKGEYGEYKRVLSVVRRYCGSMQADAFGPKVLKEIRQDYVDQGHSRGTINRRIAKVVRMFQWGVEEEMLEPAVHQKLAAVRRLQRGRTEAKEAKVIHPVADDVVEATIVELPEVVADMIRLQL